MDIDIYSHFRKMRGDDDSKNIIRDHGLESLTRFPCNPHSYQWDVCRYFTRIFMVLVGNPTRSCGILK
jgi:hypothetical protein